MGKIVTEKKGPLIPGFREYLNYPIAKKDFLDGIQWPIFPTEKQALCKLELERYFDIYERHRAYFQPIKTRESVQWQVVFPKSSKWKNGPMRPKASDAIDANYTLNKKFPGEQELAKGDGATPLQVDQIIDEALRNDERVAEGEVQE